MPRVTGIVTSCPISSSAFSFKIAPFVFPASRDSALLYHSNRSISSALNQSSGHSERVNGSHRGVQSNTSCSNTGTIERPRVLRRKTDGQWAWGAVSQCHCGTPYTIVAADEALTWRLPRTMGQPVWSLCTSGRLGLASRSIPSQQKLPASASIRGARAQERGSAPLF